MAANYVLLASQTVGAAGASSVTFSNIPQTYTDLLIRISARDGDTSGALTAVSFNGLTTNLSSKRLRGTGTAATSSTFASNIYIASEAGSYTASIFSSSDTYIANYANANFKTVSDDSTGENNAAASEMQLTTGLWNSTAAITSITLTAAVSPYVQYSTFYLYGLAASGVTPVIAPFATGGNVTNDGTYWIHTFLASGTFTPLKTLSCDYLVVAGGGGGAMYGGGGGAGGFRTSTAFTVSGSFIVTVGAGGAGTGTQGVTGVSGSDSVLSSITSTGGGGAGAYGSGTTGSVGLTGGSGGGGGSPDTGGVVTGAGGAASPVTSPVQGYAGGSGITDNAGYRLGGGGGGASATGANATATQGGAGGNGSSNSYSGSAVTYAGGGGGGVNSRGGGKNPGAGGTGGGGNGADITISSFGYPGTANTGGGGGGGASQAGGNGGSGIVIVRYAMV